MFLTEQVASILLGLQQMVCSWMRSAKAGHLACLEFRHIPFFTALAANLSRGLTAQSAGMSFLRVVACVVLKLPAQRSIKICDVCDMYGQRTRGRVSTCCL